MNTMRPITLRLDAKDHERLQAEARRLGIPLATLVRMYVRARLNDEKMEAEQRRRSGLQALDELAELTADLPPIDAVRIARESREELSRRPAL